MLLVNTIRSMSPGEVAQLVLVENGGKLDLSEFALG